MIRAIVPDTPIPAREHLLQCPARGNARCGQTTPIVSRLHDFAESGGCESERPDHAHLCEWDDTCYQGLIPRVGLAGPSQEISKRSHLPEWQPLRAFSPRKRDERSHQGLHYTLEQSKNDKTKPSLQPKVGCTAPFTANASKRSQHSNPWLDGPSASTGKTRKRRQHSKSWLAVAGRVKR